MKKTTTEETNPLVLSAMREIELAKKYQHDGSDAKSDIAMNEYVDACYDSALKAYKSLAEDGHSGMSWSITRRILEDLMHDRPLCPIEDVPESWNLVGYAPLPGHTCFGPVNGHTYQCNRRSSLFKDEYPDGTVKFSDNGNNVLVEVNLTDGHTCGLGSKRSDIILGKYAPEALEIKFPYMPPRERWVVRVSSEINSTIADHDKSVYFLSYIKKPNGEYIDINKFVLFDGSGNLEELIEERVVEYSVSLTDEQLKWVKQK